MRFAYWIGPSIRIQHCFSFNYTNRKARQDRSGDNESNINLNKSIYVTEYYALFNTKLTCEIESYSAEK